MMDNWEIGSSVHLQGELKNEGFGSQNQMCTEEEEESNQSKNKRIKLNSNDSEKEGELVASLKQEIEHRDGQILKMQQKYDETVASYEDVVNGLTELNNIKSCNLMEMELLYERKIKVLVDEKAKLNDAHLAEAKLLQSQIKELHSRLRWKSTALEKSKTQKSLECTKLEKEVKVLKEKLQNQNATSTEVNFNNLVSQVTVLRAELEEKSERLQNLEGLNNTLTLKELNSRKKLQEACNEFIALREELEEKADYLESLNNILILTESISKRELQEARSESITSLKDMLNNRTTLVIKRLGEIDLTVFQNACLRKFPNGDWEEISAKLCSSWEEHLRDANWQPFKTVDMKGKLQEIVDEDDEKLKKLRSNYGEEVYMTVTNALMEMNEHNPSGRYLVSEIWIPKERRIATMKEIIQFLVKQVQTLKQKR